MTETQRAAIALFARAGYREMKREPRGELTILHYRKSIRSEVSTP